MRLRAEILASLVALAAGCATQNPGDAPPLDDLHYPVSLGVVEGATPGTGTLYVVNSNFDLLYNRGTVVAIDLAAYGGVPDGPVEQGITSGVELDSFGGKLALYTPRDATATQRTLFVPTRGDHRIYALHADGGALSCWTAPEGGDGRDCLAQGISTISGAQRAFDPFAATVHDGRLFVTHLTNGDTSNAARASYLLELDPETPGTPFFHPIGLTPSESLASTPVGLFFAGRQVDPSEAAPLRLLAGDAVSGTGLYENSHIKDARGLAPSSDGTRLYVATKNPDGLATLDIARDASTGAPTNRILDFVPLPKGGADIAVIARPGRRDLVAVSCATSNLVALYDSESGELASVQAGIRGPYGMAVGSRPGGGARLFVAAFGSHSIEVIDVPSLVQPSGAALVGRLTSRTNRTTTEAPK